MPEFHRSKKLHHRTNLFALHKYRNQQYDDASVFPTYCAEPMSGMPPCSSDFSGKLIIGGLAGSEPDMTDCCWDITRLICCLSGPEGAIWIIVGSWKLDPPELPIGIWIRKCNQ